LKLITIKPVIAEINRYEPIIMELVTMLKLNWSKY